MSYVFDNSSLFMSKWNRVDNLRKLMEKIKSLKHRNMGHQKTASNTSLVYACTKLIFAGIYLGLKENFCPKNSQMGSFTA